MSKVKFISPNGKLTPDQILEMAKQEELDYVLVIGEKDGVQNIFTTGLEYCEINWLADKLKEYALSMGDESKYEQVN